MKKGLAAGVLILGLAAAAAVWVGRAPRFAHAVPGYPMVDLTGVVARAEAGEADYRLLFAQTGLGAPAVDALLEEGRGGELEDFQARYFAPCAWKTVKGAAVVRLEVTEKDFEFAPLEKGDILLTPSSRCGGWRNGHAALVVDAEEGLVLEAYSLGCPSQLSSLSTWQDKAAPQRGERRAPGGDGRLGAGKSGGPALRAVFRPCMAGGEHRPARHPVRPSGVVRLRRLRLGHRRVRWLAGHPPGHLRLAPSGNGAGLGPAPGAALAVVRAHRPAAAFLRALRSTGR